MKTALLAALLACASAAPVLAGSPPIAGSERPTDLTARCLALGTKGEVLAGGDGCRNAETGAAILCAGDRCTEYFADPRHARIKAILDANRRPQQRPL